MSLISRIFYHAQPSLDWVRRWRSRSLDALPIPGCKEPSVVSGVNWFEWLESADLAEFGRMNGAFWRGLEYDLSGLIVRGTIQADDVALRDVVSVASCATRWWRTYRWSLPDFGASLVHGNTDFTDRNAMMAAVIAREDVSVIDDAWRHGVHWNNTDGGHRIAASRYLDGLSDRPYRFPANIHRRSLSRAAVSRLASKVVFVMCDSPIKLSSFAAQLTGVGIGCAHVHSCHPQSLPLLAGAVAVDVRSRAVRLWIERQQDRDASLFILDPARY